MLQYNPQKKNTVLIVEDNMAEAFLLRPYLESAQFNVLHVSNVNQALTSLDNEQIDAVLLDLNLPDDDGLVLLRKLRSVSNVPVIAVSGRNSDTDRITGLEMGANDYVAKPYHPRELLLRLNNVLRQIKPLEPGQFKQDDAGKYLFGSFILDISRRTLLDAERNEISLTTGEFNLLCALAIAKGRVLSRDHLLDAVSRRDELASDRTIDVMISRIRKKIEQNPKKPDLLITETGLGYKLCLK